MRSLSHTFRGWLPLLVLPASAFVFWPVGQPRWLLMWTMAGAIYAGFKWLTWRRTETANVSASRQVAYLLLWPGMDSVTFLDAGHAATVSKPTFAEWLTAALKLGIGIVLFRDIFGLTNSVSPIVLGWSGMVGFMLILHFGLFELLSCFWRANGIDAKPLMNQPIRSTSLADLWSHRWNTAFRDLMHRFLFKPFVPHVGPRGALWTGFAISGVIHDVVMSLPAGGGYGGPTLYFLIQAAGLLAERSAIGRTIGLGRGRRGWLFAMLVLIGPSPLLLHPPFVDRIVVPFVLAARSL